MRRRPAALPTGDGTARKQGIVMSSVYDTMRRVWDKRIVPRLDHEELVFRFGALIDAMHSANHRLDDGVNKDREADVAARKLDRYVSGNRGQVPAERRTTS
jgi:hypothetical protein